ncbi:hypothetical protein NP493_599g01019 [Ridgeia piscesae]|uniref:Uncharacterized protein n=1 Tax=Ridgeia piscesae TaxID=27915 RepID=A0AAD9KTS9_RIDPI|nr:hypothetical protein NP493_599g01019 [Ridgeia piscesae]
MSLDDSTDLRLAEFRRRLASGRLVDATAMTIDRSPSGQELEQHMSGAAMDTDKRPRVTALGTGNTVPLASPSVPPGTRLTQQGEGDGEDMAPHLHLSCDILQCRHDHHQTEGDTGRQRQCDRTHTRDTRCRRGGDGHSGRHTAHPGHVDQRGDTDDGDESDTDRSDRTGRVKHRSTQVTSHGDVSRDNEAHTDRLVQGDVSRRVDSSGQRTRPVGGRQKATRRGSRRQTGPEPEQEGHDGDVTYGEEDTSSGQKEKRPLSSREGAGDRLVRGCDPTTEDGAGVTGGTRRLASKTTAAGRPDRRTPTDDDVGGLGRSTRPGGRGRKSGKTSQSHPARSHSSPTRSVTSAIGQVVGSQLFGSSASLTSSVDSDLARPLSPVTSPPARGISAPARVSRHATGGLARLDSQRRD